MENLKNILRVIVLMLILGSVSFGAESAKASSISLGDYQNVKKVESFEVEYLSDIPNEEGLYELLGYKKVNSIWEVTKTTDAVETVLTSVEDYYDLEGKFIESKVVIGEYENDYNTGEANVKIRNKEFKSPQTIKVNKKTVNSEDRTLINEDKVKVENHIANLIKDRKSLNEKSEKVKGLTKEDLAEIKAQINKIQLEHKNKESIVNTSEEAVYQTAAVLSKEAVYQTAAVQRAGAYDNYYNYDYTTGKFTIQALGYNVDSRYFHRTGSTINNSTNATLFNSFKNNIDNYELNIINYMEASKWSNELAIWASAIASAIVFMFDKGTGPEGWLGAMLAVYSTIELLGSWTSALYATYQRAEYSRNAQKYLRNAQNLIAWGNWQSSSVKSVIGY